MKNADAILAEFAAKKAAEDARNTEEASARLKALREDQARRNAAGEVKPLDPARVALLATPDEFTCRSVYEAFLHLTHDWRNADREATWNHYRTRLGLDESHVRVDHITPRDWRRFFAAFAGDEVQGGGASGPQSRQQAYNNKGDEWPAGVGREAGIGRGPCQS